MTLCPLVFITQSPALFRSFRHILNTFKNPLLVLSQLTLEARGDQRGTIFPIASLSPGLLFPGQDLAVVIPLVPEDSDDLA